uniref:Chromosome segregation ATPase n=1 Tax=Marseillevirus LCMAC201 TaxID=2506605 RepID=A0A481YWR1_9VIRU|nr:MAG: chromosome segregation ATPase [Marseillevirus LCMAC201]
MRIKLCNFRCHTDAEFELPDQGLVLLAGSSGSGKSTLLKAISYVLFGSKAIRKPYTFGTTTCSVTLEFMGMKVHRTNRPNRVIVNDDLEDAAAQAYIDEKLGVGYDEFLISSYIPQKNNSSVLSLSQAEQLQMIKTLAFDGEQNKLHKEKLKEMVRNSSDVLVEKRTETQFLQQEVDRLQDIIDPIEFPLMISEEETEDISIAKYHKRISSYNQRMTTFLECKTQFNEELQNHAHAIAELDMTSEKLVDINNQLTRITARHQQLVLLLKDIPKDLKDQIKSTELQILYLEHQKEYTVLEKQYTQIKTDEACERDTQKEELERKLWKYCGCEKDPQTAKDELENYQQQLRLWKQFLTAQDKLKKLQKDLKLDELSKKDMINHLQELLAQTRKEKATLYSQKEQLTIAAEKLALEKEIIHCPECEAPLRWQDKNLVSVHSCQPVEDRDYSNDIQIVEKRICDLDNTKTNREKILQRVGTIVFPSLSETDPQVYKQMKQDVQRLTIFISQNEQCVKELARIARESTDNYVSPALKGIKQQLNTKKEELGTLDASLCSAKVHKPASAEAYSEKLRTNASEDIAILCKQLHDLEDQYAHHQEHAEEHQEVNTELAELRRRVKRYSLSVETIKQQVAGIDEKTIKKKITVVNRNIAKNKKKQLRDEELGEKVTQYLFYRDQQKELDRWEHKLANVVKRLKTAEKIHTAHLTLKDKYVQAEILALDSTINSINEHTRYYLDTFFTDHQLSVALTATHKGKKIQTLKISTVINYKGNEYDNITQMSGGEFDRCTLSSICGINSMLGSPILVLDESLASLDADTNTEIIRFLSGLAEDKLILVCSHEAVRGIFDQVVEL